MKNRLFILMAFAAIFAGCSKEVAPVETPENGFSSFSITASLSEPETKLSYTAQEDGSYKASFNSSDKIMVFFVKSDKSVSQSTTLAVDPYTISTDGKKAVFNVTNFSFPSDYEKIVAYLTSSTSLSFSDSLGTVDLSTQKTAAEANNRHVLCGTLNKTDLKSTEPGKLFADVKMSYKTSLLNFKFTLPVKPSLSNEITLRSNSDKLHNSVSSIWGDIDASSKLGEILVLPTSVDTVSNTITALACVWAADTLSDLFVSVQVEDLYYGGDLNLKKTTLEAGKVYYVSRELKMLAQPADVWANDEAGEATYASAEGEELTSDFLSCKNNVVSWTANTTGKPRTGTLKFKNGGVFTLTQIEAKDFQGDWTFTVKRFVNPGAVVTDPANISVKIDTAIKGYELFDALSASHTNNVSISGLYETAVADACVDISYTGKWAKVGIFLDTRDGEGQKVGNNYVYFAPELATLSGSAWGSPYNFITYDQGDPDYSWIWFKVSSDFNQFIYLNRTADTPLQVLTQYPSTTMNNINGFCVLSSPTNICTADCGITAYTVVYQVNTSGKTGEYFTRK